MDSLKSEFLMEVRGDLEAPLDLGATPRGIRQIVNVTGGSFEGPKLRGVVLPNGGDWLIVRLDGVVELDVRTTLRTDDNHLIYSSFRGLLHAPRKIMKRLQEGDDEIDPSAYYFRTTPLFETGSERYDWLNRMVTVGVGKRTSRMVQYRIFAIL